MTETKPENLRDRIADALVDEFDASWAYGFGALPPTLAVRLADAVRPPSKHQPRPC